MEICIEMLKTMCEVNIQLLRILKFIYTPHVFITLILITIALSITKQISEKKKDKNNN